MQLKRSNRYRNSNNFKNNDGANTCNNDGRNNNMCRKKGNNQEWSECPNNQKSKNDLGTMADGARGTVTIIMKTEIEIATDSATIMAIDIPPEVERENIAVAVAESCPAQSHGVLITPLGHPLSVLTKPGTPSAGVPDAQ